MLKIQALDSVLREVLDEKTESVRVIENDGEVMHSVTASNDPDTEKRSAIYSNIWRNADCEFGELRVKNSHLQARLKESFSKLV
ncbi:hypothetical protein Ciccas_009362 [Cichlidogyrus casuarinus]|uniref:Uncharacterized protein n=1 Tax=Cichlidogyrus casuarinus TaxID=1844966 RepID=A0ABD2Q1P6_9PLAT